jgi:hypothetical protein
MPYPDVFVSYSSRDRERVLAIANALEARGVSLWIDTQRIDGSQAFIREIPPAVAACKGLIVFVSSSSAVSDYVEREVHLAISKKKPILPVMLDAASLPDSFEFLLGLAQRITLPSDDPRECAESIGRGLRHWDLALGEASVPETQLRAPIAPRPTESGMGELVPYLVDRIQQEHELRNALDDHCVRTPRRPLVLLVHGADEQAIHEYLYRVQYSSLPNALRFVGYDDHVKWTDLGWPPDGWENVPVQTVENLKQDVLSALALRRTAWSAGIVEAVGNLRCVVVLCYRLTVQRWSEMRSATLRAWIESWAELPDLPPRHPAIVLIMVKRVSAAPTLMHRLGLVRTGSPAEHLRRLADGTRSDLNVVMLTELGNVTFDQIEQWVVQEVRPRDPGRMIAELKRVMDDPQLFRGPGVPMGRLLERLSTVFENTVREHATA